MLTTRRSLITGLATFLAAPAIVRATSIMSVKAWVPQSPATVLVESSGFKGYMGLAQLKAEGEVVAFDAPLSVAAYPVAPGERILIGEPVFLNRRDGYAYARLPREALDNRAFKTLGFAISST